MADLEMAYFTERARQDRHWHVRGTEIYTVLEGEMAIEVESETHVLAARDSIVIRPGAVHRVLPEGRSFLCQVVTAACGGGVDKFVVR